MTITLEDGELTMRLSQVAAATGESVDELVSMALREKWGKGPEVQGTRPKVSAQALKAIQDRYRTLPVLDPRSPEKLLEYDEFGMFGE